MNYAAFERMQTGALSRLENEPEQDYIVQVIHRWLVLQMNAPSVR